MMKKVFSVLLLLIILLSLSSCSIYENGEFTLDGIKEIFDFSGFEDLFDFSGDDNNVNDSNDATNEPVLGPEIEEKEPVEELVPIYEPVVPAYSIDTTPDYSYDIFNNDVYISLTRTDMTISNYSFEWLVSNGYIYDDEIEAIYGYTYYFELKEQENEYGYILVRYSNKEKILYLMDMYLQAFGISIYDENGEVIQEYFMEFLFKQDRFTQ